MTRAARVAATLVSRPLAIIGVLAIVGVLASAVSGRADPLSLHVEPLSLAGFETGRLGVELNATPLAAFRLRATDRSFGGLSGLLVSGDQALMVSDAGAWFGVTLTRDADGRVTDIRGESAAPIRSFDGKPVSHGGRDAESIARGSDGVYWLGFERWHRVVAYDSLAEAPVAQAAQLPDADLAYNGGVEALAIDPDGALIAIAERPLSRGGALTGWRMIAGRADVFTIERIDGYSATGADIGPDGALYLLERRFRLLGGVRMRVRRFPKAVALLKGGGAPIDLGAGETVLNLGAPAPIDNMEGIAVEASPSRAGVLIHLVSDDNFNIWQSTIWLQFAYPRR